MQRNIPQSFDNIQPVTIDVSGWLGRVSPMSKQSLVAQPSPYIRPRIGRMYERGIKELQGEQGVDLEANDAEIARLAR